MTAEFREHVLCVDDEPQILEGLALHLRRRYQVSLATSGAEALELLARDSSIAVIISDMRMPGMDGAAFLGRARHVAPDTPRILLTGHASMESAIAAVNEGQLFKFLTKPCTPQVLLESVEAAVRQYRAQRLERSGIRRLAEERVAGQDLVTGLAGRDRLVQLLESAPARAAPDAPDWTVYFMDVARLHALEEHGDGLSDELLRALANQLRTHFTDALCVARWGAEQFAVVVVGGDTDEDVLRNRGQRLLRVLTEPVRAGRTGKGTGVNIGIARWPRDSTRPRVVIRYAEMAAREAKRLGGAVCIFRREWSEQLERREAVLAALPEAIERNLLHLNFQPIVDIAQQRVHALECLLRWNHPTLGSISPATFIPLAEEAGLMVQLGSWVLQRACHEARYLVGRHGPRLAVNVSVQQLMHDAFLAEVNSALRVSGLDPKALELEVTESVVAQDFDRMLWLLPQFQERGITIAIDDFGTGYSSLSCLNLMPADVLKVDRSFVRDFDVGGEAIISAALSIAHSRSMEVVIEGVETAAMLEQASRLGATLIQGYYFARPMDVGAAASWVKEFAPRARQAAS
ncbi:MAG: putative bifunctional diguanylate cyclase/phosphodiesterase [Steroidobacterales bacterium]